LLFDGRVDDPRVVERRPARYLSGDRGHHHERRAEPRGIALQLDRDRGRDPVRGGDLLGADLRGEVVLGEDPGSGGGPAAGRRGPGRRRGGWRGAAGAGRRSTTSVSLDSPPDARSHRTTSGSGAPRAASQPAKPAATSSRSRRITTAIAAPPGTAATLPGPVRKKCLTSSSLEVLGCRVMTNEPTTAPPPTDRANLDRANLDQSDVDLVATV